MKIIKYTSLLLLSLSAILFVHNANANLLSTSSSAPCKLGVQCHLEGGNGKMVYYNVTKKDGERYYCSIQSESNVLRVMVKPDKGFNFFPRKWYSYSRYRAIKAVSANHINGQFLEDGLGQIKFINTIACYTVSDEQGGDLTICKDPAVNIMCNAVK